MEFYFDGPTSTSILVTGAPSPEAAYQGAINYVGQVLANDQLSYEVSGTGQSPNDEGRYEFGVAINNQ
jgi:hypothetical protein